MLSDLSDLFVLWYHIYIVAAVDVASAAFPTAVVLGILLIPVVVLCIVVAIAASVISDFLDRIARGAS